MTKLKKSDKLIPPVKIVEETKEKVEAIKQDAKRYYRWKNLVVRYVFMWFLLILLILQFFLPNIKEQSNTKDIENSPVSSTKVFDLETSMDFLWEDIDINTPEFDEAKATILSDREQLLILYKRRPAFLAKYENAFKKAWLSTDYMYLAFLNWLDDDLWFLPDEAVEAYKLQEDTYIDELYHADKTTRVAIDYLKDLQKKYNDPKLALLWYIMWSDALDNLMSEQWVKSFDDLYLEDFLNSWYYSVVAYKYIFEHISNYIDIENTITYPIKDTKTVAVREIDDLVLWAKDHWYTIKEIKELNPWILWNSLPKGKREIEVYKK